jgi:hypothetical protein
MKKESENIKRTIEGVATITGSVENTFRILAGGIREYLINSKFRSPFLSVCFKLKGNLRNVFAITTTVQKQLKKVSNLLMFMDREMIELSREAL